MAAGRELRAKLVLGLSDRATAGLARLQARLQTIRDLAKSFSSLTGLGRVLTSVQGLAGGLLVGAGLVRSVQSAADFQTALVDLTNTMGLTGEAARRMQIEVGKDAEQLARRFRTSAGTVLEGMKNLLAQGLSEGAMRGLIEDVTALTVAERVAVSASAELAGSLHSILDVPLNRVGNAMGRIITGGRLGAVEIRDFAAAFPTLATQMRGLGVTGDAAVNTIVAGLEVARKGAGTAGEAITNFDNLLSKFAAPETVRAFRDFGVDLPGVFRNAERQGINAFDAIIQQIRRVTAGDPFKMSELFGDMQANKALRPLIGLLQEFATMREQIAMSGRGVLDTTLDDRLKTYQAQIDLLGENADAIARRLGRGFALGLGEMNRNLITFIDWWDALPSKIGHAHENWERLKGSMNGFLEAAGTGFDELVSRTLAPFNRALETANRLMKMLRERVPSWSRPETMPETTPDEGGSASRLPLSRPARPNPRGPNRPGGPIRPQSGEDALRGPGLREASAGAWQGGGKLQIELVLSDALKVRRTDTDLRGVSVSATMPALGRGRMLPAV